ncbi:MAG: BolA family transcriptional regulator [Bacteriovoracaceae bacterium]|nr:BolA family transcriptional regulator [Bacteriovoracaceae bacterium]
MDNFLLVENLIKTQLTDAKVEVTDMTGTMDHLEITIASDAFKGKMLLQQHRMIMDILKDALAGPVHAVKLKTMTLDKYSGEKK